MAVFAGQGKSFLILLHGCVIVAHMLVSNTQVAVREGHSGRGVQRAITREAFFKMPDCFLLIAELHTVNSGVQISHRGHKTVTGALYVNKPFFGEGERRRSVVRPAKSNRFSKPAKRFSPIVFERRPYRQA